MKFLLCYDLLNILLYLASNLHPVFVEGAQNFQGVLFQHTVISKMCLCLMMHEISWMCKCYTD